MATILEPGFETVVNWTYSEIDTNNAISGGQSSGIWNTEGTYSYGFNTNGTPTSDDYAQCKQTINIPLNFGIYFDAHQSNTGVLNKKMQVLIDTTVVWEKSFISGEQIYLNQFVDLSSYSGSHDLIFRFYIVSGAFTSGSECQFDNIRETLNDIYIALTGNDSNSGGTLISSKLTLYGGINSLSTGGNLHIGFGDFSAQTSFQISKSMTWVFDTSGGIGTTTFPLTI